METSKDVNDVIVFRGKEYSVGALKAIAKQGLAVKVSRENIDGVNATAELAVVLDTVIVVQSKDHYDHVYGKLQEDQSNKGAARLMQTVRLFSTYGLKKALLSNVLAMQEPVRTAVLERKTYESKRR